MLDLLCQAERTVEALAAEPGMSVANTSQYLQDLQAARLVETTKNGRHVVYRLADALVSDFFRRFRLLAENRLRRDEQIRRRFFSEGEEVNPVDRKSPLRTTQGSHSTGVRKTKAPKF